MENITYLLGAGASANAIPVITSMPSRLREFKNVFNLIKNKLVSIQSLKIGDVYFDGINFSNLHKEADKLLTNILQHSSVDTYAKKLYLADEKDKYNLLKHLLNLYLIYEQVKTSDIDELINANTFSGISKEDNNINIKYRDFNFDTRYDVFVASILGKGPKWPDHIKIISYNYDNQIDLALDYYESPNNKLHPENEDFIIRLNGKATPFNSVKKVNKDDIVNHLNIDSFIKAFKIFHNNCDTVDQTSDPSINFSWEWKDPNKEYIMNRINTTQNIIGEADSFVIIGYSFPEFNREVDSKILSSVRPQTNVFIQVHPDQQKLVSERIKRFSANRINENIKFVDYIEQFFIP